MPFIQISPLSRDWLMLSCPPLPPPREWWQGDGDHSHFTERETEVKKGCHWFGIPGATWGKPETERLEETRRRWPPGSPHLSPGKHRPHLARPCKLEPALLLQRADLQTRGACGPALKSYIFFLWVTQILGSPLCADALCPLFPCPGNTRTLSLFLLTLA